MNSNVLTYKGYYAKVEYNSEDNVLVGKIIGLSDTIAFACENVSEVESCFHETVDDYLDMCERYGKDPEKTYKGSFNVRVDPETHRKLVVEALKQGVSLNEFVSETLEKAVSHENQSAIESFAQDGSNGYRKLASYENNNRPNALLKDSAMWSSKMNIPQKPLS